MSIDTRVEVEMTHRYSKLIYIYIYSCGIIVNMNLSHSIVHHRITIRRDDYKSNRFSIPFPPGEVASIIMIFFRPINYSCSLNFICRTFRPVSLVNNILYKIRMTFRWKRSMVDKNKKKQTIHSYTSINRYLFILHI